ncbi:MAG: NACHT domain-containing protein [Tagaea sp.]
MDPNLIASAAAAVAGKTVVSSLVEQVSKTLVSSAVPAMKHLASRLRAEFQLGFSDYLDASYRRCAWIKTLISGDRPVSLLSMYVPLQLKCGNLIKRDEDVISLVDDQKLLVITGLADCGKSMFMKYFTICRFENPKDSIPLFVELRHFNRAGNKSLLTFVRDSCSTSANSVSEDAFFYALQNGGFTLILDGFDELTSEKKDIAEDQVKSILEKFPAVKIVVSSRPDERFRSWSNFYVYRVQKLSQDQVISLIEKIDFDLGVKKRFIGEIKTSLYESHQSFMQVPLLATMMLLTYKRVAEISNKIHLFYQQAFDTLFREHDALKDQYTRSLQTGLSPDDFASAFAAFSAASYLDSRVSFEKPHALEYARRASDYCLFKFDAEAFLRDLKDNICVLQQDGLELAYVHRSFQEYFTAVFASRFRDKQLRDSQVKSLILTLAARHSDNVLYLLFLINRDLVEDIWVSPVLDRLLRAFSKYTAHGNFTGTFSIFYERFIVAMSEVEGAPSEPGKNEQLISAMTIKASKNKYINNLYTLHRMYGKPSTPDLTDVFFKSVLSERTVEKLQSVFGKPRVLTEKESLEHLMHKGPTLSFSTKTINRSWAKASGLEAEMKAAYDWLAQVQKDIKTRRREREKRMVSKKFV